MTVRSITVLTLFVLGSLAIVVAAQNHQSPPSMGGMSGSGDDTMTMSIRAVADTKWVDGPTSLPKGAQMAVLEGDPAKEGPFVFRIKAPDGYRVPPHTHPKVERITVIQGTFNVGMGETFDEKATQPMPTGTYGYWPAGMTHFVWCKGETILQFHGDNGPWNINYVNAADDPRNAKTSQRDGEANQALMVKNQTVDAACGACIFKMPGVTGCPLAVTIDGKHYLVDGATWPNHDYCDRKCQAVVTGKVEGDRFVATALEAQR